MARDEKREAARSYTLAEVLAGGFEARCLAPDGTRYLLCQGSALRVDPHTREAILVSDLGGLPGGPWSATRFGLRQLAEAKMDETAVSF